MIAKSSQARDSEEDDESMHEAMRKTAQVVTVAATGRYGQEAGCEPVGYGVVVDHSLEGENAMPDRVRKRRHAIRERRRKSGFVTPTPDAITAEMTSESAAARCKLCFWALKGVLSGPASMKKQRTGDESRSALHDGILFLAAVKQLYDAASPQADNDEICAAIAREWNRVVESLFSKRDAEHPLSLSETERFLDRLAKTDLSTRGGCIAKEKERDYSEDSIDVSGSDARDRTGTIEGDFAIMPPSLTTDDVAHHFECCVRDIIRIMRTHIDDLQDIQAHLLENCVWRVIKDTLLDEDDGVAVPHQSTPGSSRTIIDAQGLSMYLCTLNATRGLSSEIRATLKDTGPPAAYSALALECLMVDSAHANPSEGFSAKLRRGSRSGAGKTTGF
jgi:hypothetical protein